MSILYHRLILHFRGLGKIAYHRIEIEGRNGVLPFSSTLPSNSNNKLGISSSLNIRIAALVGKLIGVALLTARKQMHVKIEQ